MYGRTRLSEIKSDSIVPKIRKRPREINYEGGVSLTTWKQIYKFPARNLANLEQKFCGFV